MEGLEIRVAHDDELNEIIALYNMTWIGSDTPLSHKVGEKIYRGVKERPDGDMYVAVSDGRVVGTVTVFFRESDEQTRECVAENVAIYPSFRRQGIGRRLVEFVMAECRKKGCSNLIVAIRDNEADSASFYEALGFERHERGYHKEIA